MSETTRSGSSVISDRIVQEYLTTNFGEEAVRIIKAATEEMTDDALAAKVKLKVSEVRMVLNKMHNLRLAEYTRIKDKDTGWYSYVWRVNLTHVYGVLDDMMRNEISSLNAKMEENTTILSYICSKCSKDNIIDFDLASRLQFRCPHCNRRLYEKRNSGADVEERLVEMKDKHTSLLAAISRREETRLAEEAKRLRAERVAIEAAALKAAKEQEASKVKSLKAAKPKRAKVTKSKAPARKKSRKR